MRCGKRALSGSFLSSSSLGSGRGGGLFPGQTSPIRGRQLLPRQLPGDLSLSIFLPARPELTQQAFLLALSSYRQ